MRRPKRSRGIIENSCRESQTQPSRLLDEDDENTDAARRIARGRDGVESSSTNVHLNNTEADVADHEGNMVKAKTRGCNNMPRVWARKEQVEVMFDKLGKPIGANKSEYVEFIGTLVRNGSLIPLDYEDWHKVPMSIKKNLIDLIKEKFCGSFDLENVAWDTLSKNWRAWKNRVKSKYFDPNSSIEENLRKRPDTDDERVLPNQWKNLVIRWSSDKARKISAQNKENRSQKKMMHVTRKRSFSQIRDQLKKEPTGSSNAENDVGDETGQTEDGEDPSRVALFEKCYTKDGESSNLTVVETWRKMQDKVKDLSPISKDVGPNDIFSQVVGEDKWGRVRMYGYGISTCDVYGDTTVRGKSSRMHVSYKKDIDELKQIVLEQNRQIQELLKVNMQRSLHNSPPEETRVPSSSSSRFHPTTIRPSTTSSMNNLPLQVGSKVLLKSAFDSSKTVAIGFLRSLDPSERVGQVSLGNNWCEVVINVAVEVDEELIRPTSHFKTIGEAIGEVIPWPKNMVAMAQD